MHVNLILTTEQRSASPVSMRLAIGVVLAALAMLLLLALFQFFYTFSNLQHNVRWARQSWTQNEPKYRAALRLRNDLATQKAVLEEINGWRRARIEWGKELEGLQKIVPPSIQLTELRAVQIVLLVTNNTVARAFEMRLVGKTREASGASVNEVRLQLVNQPPFAELVDEALIPPGAFKQDPAPGASKSDRVFEIVCRCRPRKFE